MANLLEKVKAARRAGVPITVINTTDPCACAAQVVRELNGKVAAVGFDIVRGVFPLNKFGENNLSQIAGDRAPETFIGPQGIFEFLGELYSAVTKRGLKDTAICLFNSHLFIKEFAAIQGLMNLRDVFKGNQNMLILLGVQHSIPMELTNDLYIINDALPNKEERNNIIETLCRDAGTKATKNQIESAAKATRGLNAYATEQIAALSVGREGLNLDALKDRWRQTINSVKGLTLNEDNITLADIGGYTALKEFATMVMNGRDEYDAIIFIDEIEKMLGGSGTDTSGVSQNIFQYILTYMEDEKANGVICCGIPGAGKSMFAAALGAAGKNPIPTIRLDAGALKDSFVGASEGNTRRVFDMIRAISPRTFWVATCNNESALPPELKRRFTEGVFYFDLLSEEEKAAVWKIYEKKYPDVDFSDLPEDEGWTGAEIRNCVVKAYQNRITLKQAAEWIIPMCKVAAEKIDALRRQANGRWHSVSYKGAYQIGKNTETAKETTPLRRSIKMED